LPLLEKRLGILKASGIKTLCVGNIGDIFIAKKYGFDMIGSYGLNVTISLSLKKYHDMGVKDICVSFELNGRAVSELKGDYSRGFLSYGYLPLMRLRRCPARNNGCGNCRGVNIIKDEKNNNFTLFCSEKKFSTLYNSIPLYAADKKIENCDSEWLSFTLETLDKSKNIYDLAVRSGSPDFSRTNGLYFRKLL